MEVTADTKIAQLQHTAQSCGREGKPLLLWGTGYQVFATLQLLTSFPYPELGVDAEAEIAKEHCN